MVFIRTLLFLSLLAATALADVLINSPIAGTKWQAGQTVTVTWIAGPKGFGGTVPVVLRKGSEGNLATIGKVADADEKTGSVSFTLPTDLVSGDDYAVQVGDNYSHFFTVSGGTGTASPSATPTSSASAAASTSADPSSTASGSASTASPTNSKSPSYSVVRTVDRMAASLMALVPVALLALCWY